ncbi:uncharacterized protein [Antedon mediterranea]|uniref:uncharacterized protein n=1 Tax=Antedon mediterranea TaxID=105859 RepID=UPI003AF89DCB
MPILRKKNKVNVMTNKRSDDALQHGNTESKSKKTSMFLRILNCIFGMCLIRGTSTTNEPYETNKTDAVHEREKIPIDGKQNTMNDALYDAVNPSLSSLPIIGRVEMNSCRPNAGRKNLVVTSLFDTLRPDMNMLPSIDEIDVFTNLVTTLCRQGETINDEAKSKLMLANPFITQAKSSAAKRNVANINLSKNKKVMHYNSIVPATSRLYKDSRNVLIGNRKTITKCDIQQRQGATVNIWKHLENSIGLKHGSRSATKKPTGVKAKAVFKQNATYNVNQVQGGKWSWTQTKEYMALESILTRKIKKVPVSTLEPVMSNGVPVHLGKGSFGSVDLMKWTSKKNEKIVAVKSITPPAKTVTLSKKEKCMKTALIEAKAMQHLSACRAFPKVYAVSFAKDHEMKIIMEFIGHGTTNDSCTLLDAMFDNTSIKSGIQWLRIMKDIGNGVAFMHRKGLLHNDLALRNVLITKYELRWCAKIIDLGMVSSVNAPRRKSYNNCDTPSGIAYQIDKWSEIAPEFFQNDNTIESKATDVYSVGIIFGKVGYFKKILGLQELGKKMIDTDSKARPSMALVMKLLNRLIAMEIKGQSAKIGGGGGGGGGREALHKVFRRVR